MKELRSFIAACENALASKHFHCARILKSVGWQISEPEVTGISALKKRIKKEGGCFCMFLQKQPPPIVVPVPTSFTRPFRM
jgi:hypothetical protein